MKKNRLQNTARTGSMHLISVTSASWNLGIHAQLFGQTSTIENRNLDCY